MTPDFEIDGNLVEIKTQTTDADFEHPERLERYLKFLSNYYGREITKEEFYHWLDNEGHVL